MRKLRMPKAGLEPARLAAPPPQDGVSANSTTSARFYIFLELTSFPASSVLPGCLVAAVPARAVAAAVAEPAA
jgi:hypothetical protein